MVYFNKSKKYKDKILMQLVGCCSDDIRWDDNLDIHTLCEEVPFDVWWDPKKFIYNEMNCCYLSFKCPYNFLMWWEPDKFNFNHMMTKSYFKAYLEDYRKYWEPFLLVDKIL